MLRQQAFKFALMPDGGQERLMAQFAGTCRYVYNKALALQKERYEAGQKKLGYAGLCKELTSWRNSAETPWLADAPVHAQQQKLKDLERSYTNFFEKRAAFPNFKKKGQHDSFRYPDAKQITLDEANSRIFLPKLGWVRYRKSRDITGAVRNVTVSQQSGRWFISIQTQQEVPQPVPQATSAIGVDLGVVNLATTSEGQVIAPLNSFKRLEDQLARAQRAMSRKQKFSNNWKKARRRVRSIHTRIANARRDWLHKATSTISKNHAMVCIEDLAVKNMSRSAKGTKQKPGKHVKAKSGLNKAILDQGWREFRRQLEYKLSWSGGILVAVPAPHTSRTCPECGHVAKENRKTQAVFRCVCCRHKANADQVGAINILRAGHAQLACGEESSGAKSRKTNCVKLASAKQEPTEASTEDVGIPVL